MINHGTFGSVETKNGPRAAVGAFAVVVGLLTVVACAIPGQLYLVSPEISGEIQGATPSDPESEIRLTVTSREVPTLYDVKTIRASPAGRFRFEPTSLAVAGHEYSKVYRVFLFHRVGGEERVIWRAEFSRLDLTGPLELDCDLARPARLGQPCRVRDPLRQRWLVAHGAQTFERYCARCHGRAGRGQGEAASSTSEAGPDLTQFAARRPHGFDRDEITEWIEGSLIPREHGSRRMPIWGERLSAEFGRFPNSDELVGATLDPVVVFLWSIQTR